MKSLYYAVGAVLVILTLGYLYLEKNTPAVQVVQIQSFEDCVKAGFIVMESYPRQCRTSDGRTFTEEIKNEEVVVSATPTPILEQSKIIYNNATADNITVDLPFAGAVVGKDFIIKGRARGGWYFEASFPVSVIDKDGKVLFQGPAKALGDWMTTEFVSFSVNVKVPEKYIGPANIILKKDNPSGDSARDASVTIPINIEY